LSDIIHASSAFCSVKLFDYQCELSLVPDSSVCDRALCASSDQAHDGLTLAFRKFTAKDDTGQGHSWEM
jgi:hypothetical protein